VFLTHVYISHQLENTKKKCETDRQTDRSKK